MAEHTLSPSVKFSQNHQATMEPGVYTLTINSELKHADITTNKSASLSRRFAVFGHRFSLPEQAVRAVFPAPDSTGAYTNVLPHIIFNSTTLPWERSAVAGHSGVPWLALLLFDEGGVPIKKVVRLQTYWDTKSAFPPITPEVAQDTATDLTIIDVPRATLQAMLPTTSGLQLLAHTRQGVDASHQPVGEENAVLFANRLPKPGQRSTLHLVSLENCYDATGFQAASAEENVRLVSLKTWDFYTTEHFKITTATLAALSGQAPAADVAKIASLANREFAGTEATFLATVAGVLGLPAVPDAYRQVLLNQAKFEKTFEGLLQQLNKDIFSLRLPKHQDAGVERYLSQGLVPLRHQFRTGDDSVSWYRGPLVPFLADTQVSITGLYPETSDELLQYYDVQGMFDVTYAAAWELGRMLALASKDFSTSLFQWKRTVTHHQHRARQAPEQQHLPMFIRDHELMADAPLWEQHLLPWLTKLSNLENVPGNYLVPDEGLLPQESIRFFYLDKNWLAAALCGAFSIGGEWDKESQQAINPFTNFLQLQQAYRKGFLLRSDVVHSWPGLLVHGVTANGQQEVPLRRQVARNIVLCLFKNEVKEVVFYQKPEVMHFGLLQQGNGFFKKTRNTAGVETGAAKAVPWQGPAASRVLDISALATALGKGGQAAQFAMNMVEGVPQVTFKLA